jgi:hypothetical protein
MLRVTNRHYDDRPLPWLHKLLLTSPLPQLYPVVVEYGSAKEAIDALCASPRDGLELDIATSNPPESGWQQLLSLGDRLVTLRYCCHDLPAADPAFAQLCATVQSLDLRAESGFAAVLALLISARPHAWRRKPTYPPCSAYTSGSDTHT